MIDKLYNLFFPEFKDIEKEYLRKLIIFTNQIVYICIFISMIYFLVGYFLNINFVFYSSLLTIVLNLIVLVLIRKKKYFFSRILLILFSNLILYISCSIMGEKTGFHLFFMPLCLFSLFIFNFREKKYLILSSLISPSLIILLNVTNYRFLFSNDNIKIILPYSVEFYNRTNFFISILCTVIGALYLVSISIQKDSLIDEKESNLKESRVGLENLINSIQDGLVIVNSKYEILEVNSIFQIFCYELFNSNVHLDEDLNEYLLNKIKIDDFNLYIEESFMGISLQKEIQIQDYIFEFSFSPLLYEMEVTSVLILMKNITEFKNNQKILFENKEDLQALISSLDDIVFETTEDFIYTGIWTKNDDLLILPKNEIIGKHFDEILPLEISNTFKEYINNILKDQITTILEYQLEIAGNKKWFQAKFNLYYLEHLPKPKISVLVRDITDKKEFISELIEAKEVAEKSKKQESQFLSNMSHEIRTPLYALISLTDLVLKEKLEEKVHTNMELIKYSSGNLLSIVNDILDYSKIENGVIDIRAENFSLKELIEILQKTTDVFVINKNIEVSFTLDSLIPEILIGDSLRLNQILQNLLNNASKFTEKGFIRMDSKCIEKNNQNILIQFSVEDSGHGIEESETQSVFSAYVQKKNTQTNIKGTGLGLAITKKLVEIMNGKIWVESQVGIGSKFIFQIRFQIPNILDAVKSDSKNEIPNFQFKDKTVLLVDDYEMNRYVGSEVLKNWGMVVEFAEEGLEAIRKSREKIYDLIIMDIQMPIMNGDEVSALIRNDKNNPNQNTPIIALSADVFEEVKEKAFKAGMNAFVNKPFQINELSEIITKQLKIK